MKLYFLITMLFLSLNVFASGDAVQLETATGLHQSKNLTIRLEFSGMTPERCELVREELINFKNYSVYMDLSEGLQRHLQVLDVREYTDSQCKSILVVTDYFSNKCISTGKIIFKPANSPGGLLKHTLVNWATEYLPEYQSETVTFGDDEVFKFSGKTKIEGRRYANREGYGFDVLKLENTSHDDVLIKDLQFEGKNPSENQMTLHWEKKGNLVSLNVEANLNQSKVTHLIYRTENFTGFELNNRDSERLFSLIEKKNMSKFIPQKAIGDLDDGFFVFCEKKPRFHRCSIYFPVREPLKYPRCD